MDRRKFIKTGLVGLGAAAITPLALVPPAELPYGIKRQEAAEPTITWGESKTPDEFGDDVAKMMSAGSGMPISRLFGS